jgi:competence protein ComEC
LTPYPPRIAGPVKWLAEVLFWNDGEFREEMREAPIRFRLDKARAAGWLGRISLQKALSWIAITIFTTVGIQLGLLPVMISRFHRVSIIAPLTNVIEGALVFVLMIAGAAYLAIHAIFGELALPGAGAVNMLGWLTVKSCEPMRLWRGANLRTPDYGVTSGLIFALYFLAVLALIIVVNEWNPLRKGDELSARRRKIMGRATAIISSLTILMLGLVLVLHPFKHEYARMRLSVTFLDVGQGDAMLISFPRGTLMLLDAGGRLTFNARDGSGASEDEFTEDRVGIAEAAVMPYLWHRGIKRLDWIVASHGDADHAEGFVEVARSFELGVALKSATLPLRSFPKTFAQALGGAKTPFSGVKRGDVFHIDGAQVEVLSPFAETDAQPMSDNNESVVLKISFAARSFLLTGDIEKEGEARLVASGSDLRADVLKVAHHGSKTSSTGELLSKIKPQHAVISVADPSPFGHPHAEVIERLAGVGAKVWRTSDCGAITISTDGKDLRVETFVKCE